MSALPDIPPAFNADLVEVADTFGRVVRMADKGRSRLLAAAAQNVEWSAHMVLKALNNEGRPVRSSRIAELLKSDPSTVSRQVATLVRDGLVERRADHDDGRACLLVLTGKADAALQRHDEIRYQHFTRMLDSWSEHDLHTLATLLARFADDYEAASLDWLSALPDTIGRDEEGGQK